MDHFAYFDFYRQAFWGPNYNTTLHESIMEAVKREGDLLRPDNLTTGNVIPTYYHIAEKVAYVYKYVYHHVIALKEAFTDPKGEVLSKIEPKNEWNIVTLGDGPGVSNLPIMDVLKENGKLETDETDSEITVNNVSIDICENWAPHFYCFMEKARKKLELPTGQNSFLQQDLLAENWRGKVKKAIKNADVICMNSFCSLVYRKPGYTRMLEKILLFTKKDAIIVLVDNLYGNNNFNATEDDKKVIPDEIQVQLEELCTEIWRAPKPIEYHSGGYGDPLERKEYDEVCGLFDGMSFLTHSNPQPCFWRKC